MGSGTSSARHFHDSCAGGMCLLLAPLALCWAVVAPERSCFAMKPKPQEFLGMLQVSTQAFGHISWEKKGKNTANEEDSTCKVKMYCWDFSQTFFPPSRLALWLITWRWRSSTKTTVTGEAKVRQAPSCPGKIYRFLTTSTALIEGQ